jgi:hypothetical protein
LNDKLTCSVAAVVKAGIKPDPQVIAAIIKLTGESLIDRIKNIPEVAAAGPQAYDAIILAGQIAYADAYKWVYYVSICKYLVISAIKWIYANIISAAFGVVSIIAACFLGDITKYMDDHVAVVMH